MEAVDSRSFWKNLVEGEWSDSPEADPRQPPDEIEAKRQMVRERLQKKMELHLSRITLAPKPSNEEKLSAYRKNARKSMRQMQLALERKNREIAELRKELACVAIEYENLRSSVSQIPTVMGSFRASLLRALGRRR